MSCSHRLPSRYLAGTSRVPRECCVLLHLRQRISSLVLFPGRKVAVEDRKRAACEACARLPAPVYVSLASINGTTTSTSTTMYGPNASVNGSTPTQKTDQCLRSWQQSEHKWRRTSGTTRERRWSCPPTSKRHVLCQYQALIAPYASSVPSTCQSRTLHSTDVGMLPRSASLCRHW